MTTWTPDRIFLRNKVITEGMRPVIHVNLDICVNDVASCMPTINRTAGYMVRITIVSKGWLWCGWTRGVCNVSLSYVFLVFLQVKGRHMPCQTSIVDSSSVYHHMTFVIFHNQNILIDAQLTTSLKWIPQYKYSSKRRYITCIMKPMNDVQKENRKYERIFIFGKSI